jgi:hypothetical protein
MVLDLKHDDCVSELNSEMRCNSLSLHIRYLLYLSFTKKDMLFVRRSIDSSNLTLFVFHFFLKIFI